MYQLCRTEKEVMAREKKEIYDYQVSLNGEVLCKGTRRDLEKYFNLTSFDAWKYAEKGTLYEGKYLIERTECIRKCVICGKEFQPHSPRQVTCSTECKAKNKRESSKEYNREKKGYYLRRSKSTLAHINATARKEGMTYGQYKAKEQAATMWETGKAKDRPFPQKSQTVNLFSMPIWKGVKNA